MKTFTVKSIERKPTYLVLTVKPKGASDVLQFYPGQYATLAFKKYGRLSPTRCFSMISAPTQTDELQFAMRVEGNYTQALSGLKIGQTVKLQGPYGQFIIDPGYDRQVVMLAAGIGITPFMSMLREATQSHSSTSITLLYAGRSPQDIPFYEEIIALKKVNPHLKVAFFIDDGEAGNSFIKGRIDSEVLAKAVSNKFDEVSFFICGPNGFRNNLESALRDQQVEESRIVTESFTQGSQLKTRFGVGISPMTYLLTGGALVSLTLLIMGIDLAKTVPKISAAAEIPTPTTTTTNSNNTTPAASSDSASPATTTAPTANTYQAPVSSVS